MAFDEVSDFVFDEQGVPVESCALDVDLVPVDGVVGVAADVGGICDRQATDAVIEHSD
jgi:hypothetical protein